MKLTGNTIIITGGGTGIGRGLAELFHQKGNQVIIAGRREDVLKETVEHNPGMAYRVLDITSDDSVQQFVESIHQDFPNVNAVIHNAGVMIPETIGDNDFDTAKLTIDINLTGQIRLNSALVPLLKANAPATIMTVTSGLASLPRIDFPTYCATKAAIHSYTQSLRAQLCDDNVQVIELVPPYTQTELRGEAQLRDDKAMPLADFINEAAAILESEPDVREVLVERVKFQRTAESSGEYDQRFRQFNEGLGNRV